MEELILNSKCFYRKFNDIIFLSPYKFGTEFEMDDDNYRCTLDLDFIYGRIEFYNSDENWKDKRINLLIIIDDLITSVKKD